LKFAKGRIAKTGLLHGANSVVIKRELSILREIQKRKRCITPNILLGALPRGLNEFTTFPHKNMKI